MINGDISEDEHVFGIALTISLHLTGAIWVDILLFVFCLLPPSRMNDMTINFNMLFPAPFNFPP